MMTHALRKHAPESYKVCTGMVSGFTARNRTKLCVCQMFIMCVIAMFGVYYEYDATKRLLSVRVSFDAGEPSESPT